ncbi:hypothetical protein PQX77_002801 [Marasmius sp. AFHP31]|nr:hypothetical protein PQX77_002801 [Marasmius sp. AFHP31]
MSLTIRRDDPYKPVGAVPTVCQGAFFKDLLFGNIPPALLSAEEESDLFLSEGPTIVERGSTFTQHVSVHVVPGLSTSHLDCRAFEILRNSIPNLTNWILHPPLANRVVGFCYAGTRRLGLTSSVMHVAWDLVKLDEQTVNLPFSTKLYVRDGLLVWDEIAQFHFRAVIPARYQTAHYPFTEDVFRLYCRQFEIKRRGPALILVHAPTKREVSTQFSFGVFLLLFRRLVKEVGETFIDGSTNKNIRLEVERRNNLWFLDGDIYAGYCRGLLQPVGLPI